MNLERQMSRRGFVKEAVAAGVVLAAFPDISHAEDNGEIAEAPTNIPLYFSPAEIQTEPVALGGVADQESGAVHEQSFSFIPYKSTKMPTNWIHQPGIAYNKEIDLFLGQFVEHHQTMMWAYSTPVESGATPEEIADNIMTEMTFEQRLQFEQNPDPMPWELYGEPSATYNKEIAGVDDGWEIMINMPNFTRPNYFQFQYGFLKEGNAYLFNFIGNLDPFNPEQNEAAKFADMMDALEEK